MNLKAHTSWKLTTRTLFALAAIPSLLTAQTAALPNPDSPVVLATFTVTGSLIPQASAEPIAPVAVFTEQDIRRTGAATVVEALGNLPSTTASAASSTPTCARNFSC